MSVPSLFAIVAIDAAGSEAKRAEHREGHLAHFKQHAAQIQVAGPLSGSASGSLVIYRAPSEDEARAFIMGDPFASHGVWADVQVFSFKASSGAWASAAA